MKDGSCTVRPINILTENIIHCIVLRVRGKGRGGLAQLEERVLCKHEVIGSSPIFSNRHGLIAQSVRALA